ncbi:MAG: D-cysteine desulfhydrase family protein [Anaerolineae bacterium]|nr:D-cysteine desulfhydrase family protein [Anaerolineae bacterium]
MPTSNHIQRFPLAFLPTPLHPLTRLGASLQPPTPNLQLWIKRDDQTGLAGGGNKTRKLELLVADALAQGAEMLLTTGAVQSNHCRQTAAAAARAGLACHLVLGGQPPDAVTGNLLLDRLLGAEIHWTTRENRLPRLHALAEALRAAGRRPYVITYGGSDPVGATGYVLAIEELLAQSRELGLRVDAIVVASSSGGTQAGLMVGAWHLGWDVPILGISIDEPADRLRAHVADLATRTAAHLGWSHTFAPSDIWADDSYLGGGYGVMGALERDAIFLMARTEGILLDPVYTGRAFGGLLDILRTRPEILARRDSSGPVNVVFWHTGGSPALFAYAQELA